MLPSLRRRWTARRSMSTAPPASPMAGNSDWDARWAFPPRSSTPGAYGAGRAVQLQVHHPRQRPDPLNRSNVKAIFRFSLTGRCGRTAACIFVLQGWTVFVIETLSPQNSEKYFSFVSRCIFHFSILYKNKVVLLAEIRAKILIFPLTTHISTR